jgi:aldehyde:ferredoxin oxidoreductase
MRVFNAREDINRKHDKLPKRFFKQALKGGPTDGWKLDEKNYEETLNEYYRQSGWNIETGIPIRSTLKRLGLEWIIDCDVYKREIYEE